MRNGGRRGSFRLVKRAALSNDWVGAYWRGEMPLWQAFWVWGMFVGTLFGVVMCLSAVHVWLLLLEHLQSGMFALLLAYVLVVLHGGWLTYYTWHVVSVWRCAESAPHELRWAARWFVVAVTATFWPVYLITILDLGWLQPPVSTCGGAEPTFEQMVL